MINHVIITAGPSVVDPTDVSGLKTVDNDGTIRHYASGRVRVSIFRKFYWYMLYRRLLVWAVRRHIS